jgi:hypothetical protein
MGAYEVLIAGVDQLAVGSRQLAVRVYPNPSNAIFNFEFLILNSEPITLKVYDLYGKEVATVVDQQLPAGEHVVSFDASGLPAGVYFWRQLVAGNRQHVLNPPQADEGSAVGKLIKY